MGFIASVLSIWLVAGSVVAVSFLHAETHHHSHCKEKKSGHEQSPSAHHCVLCVLAQGQVDVSDATPDLRPCSLRWISTVALPIISIASVPEFILLPERAPPVAFIG